MLRLGVGEARERSEGSTALEGELQTIFCCSTGGDLENRVWQACPLVSVIKKKSDKWKLLIALQNVSATMWPMGVLQPGLPMPSVIPKDWLWIVLNLKDCFFLLYIFILIIVS